MYSYPLHIVFIYLAFWFIPFAGWLEEGNRMSDTDQRQLKLVSNNGNFQLQIVEPETLRQIPIPIRWLIPEKEVEERIVDGDTYDTTLTAFRIGGGLTGIQLSSYEIQEGGSAQAAAGRDVFLVYDGQKDLLYPGMIDLGITKERVRSAGIFYATNNIFLLTDLNYDGFKDIGIIKEDLQFSPDNQSYRMHPPEWYLFSTNRWIHEADSSGCFPLQGLTKLPLIGLHKSPVDYIKEVYLRKNICVLDYEDFGPQAMAYALLGYQWYSWNSHGDTDPNVSYEIKVVVYKNIPLNKIKAFYPVIRELEQDFRYIEYSRAMKYIDRQIQQIEEYKQTEKQQEDTGMFENLRSRLIKTREKIINN